MTSYSASVEADVLRAQIGADDREVTDRLNAAHDITTWLLNELQARVQWASQQMNLPVQGQLDIPALVERSYDTEANEQLGNEVYEYAKSQPVVPKNRPKTT
jgi:hypothetical protein